MKTLPTHRIRSRPTALAVALLSLLAATGAEAQERPRTLPGFAEVLDVRVVNIEVVVVDREGRRVTGLRPEDFRLRVDGEVVPIDYFSEIREGGVLDADDTTAPAATADRGPVPGVPALEPGRRLRTNHLIFVDDFFSIARDRNRVLDRLEEDLAAAGEEDRFAVVAFDGKKLELLTGWTSDRAQLRQAFHLARSRRAHGLERLAELRTNEQQRRERKLLNRGLEDRVVAAGGEVPDRAFFEGRLDSVELDYANRLSDQVERSVLAATSALRSFAGPSGRKVMLILSGGWPFSPAEYTVNDRIASIDEIASGASDVQLGGRDPLFGPLANTANLLGYTLYPVDVPGLSRTVGLDASEDFTDFVSLASGPDASAGGPPTQPRESLLHDALYHLAEETGGVALLNSMRDRSLSEVIADTRDFYWLGFTPRRLENDSQHDIEVEVVGRPGVRVRSRQGYVDLSRGTEVTMMVESALLFGDPPSMKPLALRFGRPRGSGLGKMRVPLEVGISMDEITLVPNRGRYENELEIRITVMDERGNRSETSIDTIPISGDRPPRPGQMYYYETDLRLRKTEHRIVVAVYDPLSGAILSSSSEIAR